MKSTRSSVLSVALSMSKRDNKETGATADAEELHRETLPEGTTFDPWGVAHVPGSAAAMHMTRLHYPLCGDISAEDVADYPFPTVPTEAAEARRVTELRDRGLASVGACRRRSGRPHGRFGRWKT